MCNPFVPINNLRKQRLAEQVVPLLERVLSLLIHDVLECKLQLGIVLLLGLALQQQLVQGFEVLGLLEVQLVC